jgi:NADH-quinone oxidoreductase subunit M
MILILLIVIPLAGGVLGWVLSPLGPRWPRWLALLAMSAELALGILLWVRPAIFALAQDGFIVRISLPWIPSAGISFELALDGLSLPLILLTALLGLMAVGVSWSSIRSSVGFYHLNLLLVLAGITGVFLAFDLLLFYLFWELMLVPMYFLIDLWGHEKRHAAALKFFIFTQSGGLLMLLAILGLYYMHARGTGQHSFRLLDLLGTALAPGSARWLMLGFFAAFAVKLPAVPLHTWLPDAHTQAPTAGSVILAGLLLKTGAYGLLRFLLPLFPGAALEFAPVARILAVAGIIYGALLAFAQSDLKRLVAYTSVSHMGFVLLGVFVGNAQALQGVVMQMLSHGLSTGALFILAGLIQDRLHSRELDRMGGLWSPAPRLGASLLFFALASLGLPGLGNFVAEYLILAGTFRISVPLAVIASLGLVAATIYSLRMLNRTVFGPQPAGSGMQELRPAELTMLAVLAAALVWLGLFPGPVLKSSSQALRELAQRAAVQASSLPGGAGSGGPGPGGGS